MYHEKQQYCEAVWEELGAEHLNLKTVLNVEHKYQKCKIHFTASEPESASKQVVFLHAK